MYSIEEAQEVLSNNGYKLTHQREQILKLIYSAPLEHYSAEDIFFKLNQAHRRDLSLATVYRALELFTDLGLLHRVVFDDGVVRFDLKHDADAPLHHHLVCMSCGQIIEVQPDEFKVDTQPLTDRFHFKIFDYRLIFKGLCIKCQQEVGQTDDK